MNFVSLVGRLTDNPLTKELNDGTYRTVINLAVSRDYKNNEGLYDADFIKCVLWNGIASATKEYCHKGDLVGIKGKIQTNNYVKDSGEKKYTLEVVAEKVYFISTIKPKKA